MHMEISRAPRQRAAASLSEPVPVDIEACSVTDAATPPISNEPPLGSAASHSAALPALTASPQGGSSFSAASHSAALAALVASPQDGGISAASRSAALATHGAADPPRSAATSNEPQPDCGGSSPRRNIISSDARLENAAVGHRSLTIEALQSTEGGSRDQRTDSFTSRLASFSSGALPAAVAATAVEGQQQGVSKSSTSRKR